MVSTIEQTQRTGQAQGAQGAGQQRKAYEPQEVQRLFLKAFNSGDVDGMLALFEPNAILVAQPGQALSGEASLRAAMEGFLALGGKMTHAPKYVLSTSAGSGAEGDVALLITDWTLDGKGPDGSPISLAGQTADVVRRQADGSWLCAIDNPFGTV